MHVQGAPSTYQQTIDTRSNAYNTRPLNMCVERLSRTMYRNCTFRKNTMQHIFPFFGILSAPEQRDVFFVLGGDWFFFPFVHHKCYEFYLKMFVFLSNQLKEMQTGSIFCSIENFALFWAASWGSANWKHERLAKFLRAKFIDWSVCSRICVLILWKKEQYIFYFVQFYVDDVNINSLNGHWMIIFCRSTAAYMWRFVCMCNCVLTSKSKLLLFALRLFVVTLQCVYMR